MPKKKGPLRSRLEAALFACGLALFSAGPRLLRRPQAALLAGLMRRLDSRHRRVLQTNLRLAFPDKEAPELLRLQAGVYRHFASVFQELAGHLRGRPTAQVLSRARVSGGENLQAALDRRRGVLLATAHLGNWEWIGLLLQPLLHRPLYAVTRPLDNPLLEERLRRFRESCGSRIIHKQGSLRRILELLGRNEAVLLLVDLNTVPREGTAIDFFGRRAYAITTAAQLWLKRGIPIVPLFVHYGDERIEMEIFPELEFAPAGDPEADVRALTQKLNTIIEEQIRRFPEQWFWLHDRWKSQPQGGPDAPQREKK